MRNICAACIVFTFFLISLAPHGFFSILAHGDIPNQTVLMGNSFFVPDDFHTIQQAIDAAQPGDTIYVGAGTYSEHVIVNKDNINLLGHSQIDTLIAGNATGEGLKVMANNVTVSGFAVTNFATGILLDKVFNCSVLDNRVFNNKFGIWLSYSSNCLVSRNNVTNCEHNLRLGYSTNNVFTENTIYGEFSYNFGLFGSSLQHYFQRIDATNTVNGNPI